MGLLERIKSALGLGTSASTGASPSSTPERQSGSDEDAGPTPVSEAEGDEQVEGAQTVVDPADAEDVDVTVEHEPDASSEEAVKASDAAATGTDAEVEPADESTDEPSDAAGDATEAATDDATAGTDDTSGDSRAGLDLEEIKGIGPAYADRLREAGVEDVADLAAADAVDLADRTDLGEGRVQKWIDRAAAR